MLQPPPKLTTTRRTYNLSCRHILPVELVPINASMIDRRWFLIEEGKVSNIQDPQKDGNCGFKCLALVIHGDADKYGDVKNEMMKHLSENKDNYLFFGCHVKADVPKMEKIFHHRGSVGLDFGLQIQTCLNLLPTLSNDLWNSGNQGRHSLPSNYKTYQVHRFSPHRLEPMKLPHLFGHYEKGVSYGYLPINLMYDSICKHFSYPDQSKMYSDSDSTSTT
ncbi:hypothetical protein BC941DRAFT_519139 [Chlamydoabsidia padenii]|nr:hypothetical protein BC941DRAFT_519139 [Chlamydoabsidia padenii]